MREGGGGLGSHRGFCIGTGDWFVLQNSHYRSSAVEQTLGSCRLQYTMTKWEAPPPPTMKCKHSQHPTGTLSYGSPHPVFLFTRCSCHVISIRRHPPQPAFFKVCRHLHGHPPRFRPRALSSGEAPRTRCRLSSSVFLLLFLGGRGVQYVEARHR